MTFKIHILTLAATIAFGQQTVLIEKAWASDMTTTELVSLLRGAKIVNASARLSAAISGREVTVMTKRASKLTDDDCKINSVLMAKTVMTAYPIISRVKVMFAVEGNDACDQVVVRTGDVKSFDSGAVTEEILLSSLELQRVSGDQLSGAPTGSSPVAAGPHKERRMLLLSRIEDLKQSGTGVGPFMQSFQQIEELIKANNTKEAPTAIDNLARNLSEQEKLRRQAQKVSAGQGVRGASLQRSNAVKASGTPLAPVGSGQGFGGAAVPPAGSGSQPIPSAAALTDSEKQGLLHGLACTHEYLNKMRNNGVDVADFDRKIRDVENSVQKNAACAKQDLNELQKAMNQRCVAKGMK